MIKLIDLLKESLLIEYNKSQLDYISSQLGIKRNNEFDKLMNALNTQGIKYPELKDKITKGEIKSFDDLKSLKTQSKSDISKIAKSDIVKILDNDNFLILSPKTYKANCLYGAGTKWCTTMKGEEGKESFEEYTEDRPIYFIIDKSKPPSDPFYKVAIGFEKYYDVDTDEAFYERTLFNAEDKVIDERKYMKYLKSKGIDTNIFK